MDDHSNNDKEFLHALDFSFAASASNSRQNKDNAENHKSEHLVGDRNQISMYNNDSQ